jgi:hypothetical protein
MTGQEAPKTQAGMAKVQARKKYSTLTQLQPRSSRVKKCLIQLRVRLEPPQL